MAITYPRQCGSCKRFYKSPVTFCQHKKKCGEYTALLEDNGGVAVQPRNSVVNNTQNIHNTQNITNNTVNVINVGSTSLSDILAPLSKGKTSLSSSDLKAVETVLSILKNEGVTTPAALKTLIDEKSVTIQQLEQDIKNSGDQECDTAIESGAAEVAKINRKVKESKQDRLRIIDLHLKYSVVHLFRNLVLKKEGEQKIQVTSDSLATNPLFLSRDGLSVWSQQNGIEPENHVATFGKPDKNQLCKWLLVQEDRLWHSLIMDILISRLAKFLIDDHTGPLQEIKKKPEVEDPIEYLLGNNVANSEEEEHYIGGYKYEGKYADLMNRIRDFKNAGVGKDAFVSDIISELKKHLSDACKQLSKKGWFQVTKQVSEYDEATDPQQLIGGVAQLSIKAE